MDCEFNNCVLQYCRNLKPHPLALIRMSCERPASDSSVYVLESIVRGHHVYKRVWTPHLGEQLRIQREENNENDPRAVAVMKDSVIVGHLPRELARIVWFFLRRGSTARCEITGRRKKGKGLEVPCVYSFYGPSELVKKLESLLQERNLPSSCPY